MEQVIALYDSSDSDDDDFQDPLPFNTPSSNGTPSSQSSSFSTKPVEQDWELIERVSGFGDFEKFKKKHPCKYIQKYKSNEKVPNSNKYKFYVFKCTSCHNCQAQVCDKTRGTEKPFKKFCSI